MNALVEPQIDAFDGDPDPGKKRLDEVLVVAYERVDGAVMVDVDVHVEQPRGSGEGLPERLDNGTVARGGEVRNRLEWERHGGLV
jgi:hypothetical protein